MKRHLLFGLVFVSSFAAQSFAQAQYYPHDPYAVSRQHRLFHHARQMPDFPPHPMQKYMMPPGAPYLYSTIRRPEDLHRYYGDREYYEFGKYAYQSPRLYAATHKRSYYDDVDGCSSGQPAHPGHFRKWKNFFGGLFRKQRSFGLFGKHRHRKPGWMNSLAAFRHKEHFHGPNSHAPSVIGGEEMIHAPEFIREEEIIENGTLLEPGREIIEGPLPHPRGPSIP